MMSATFVSTRLANLRPPLNGPNGQATQQALGSAQDAELAMLSLVGKLRAPARLDTTALKDAGTAYQIPWYSGQTLAEYQAALVDAWPTWAESGSPQATIDQLHAYGISDVRVVTEELNHGASVTAAYNGAGTYNAGQLVIDPSGANVYEQVGPSPATAASTPPSGMGQAQHDGTCIWAWRCAAKQDPNDSGYAGWWYSRFDVVLGGQTTGGFGTLAVNKFVINNSLGVTSGSFTPPAVGSTAALALSSGSLTVGSVVYIGQAGYYQVQGGSGLNYTVLNLGDANAAYAVFWNQSGHPAGAIFAPDVWGAPNQFPNATAPVAGSQQIVPAGTGIIGQTRIGIAIVDDIARQAVKSIIVRWKATHGYPGRIVLAYDGAILDPVGQTGFHNGTSYIGTMNSLSFTIGASKIGRYDRS